MTRRGGLPWLLAVLVAAAAGLALATCSVDRAKYVNKVYACDIHEPDPTAECGAGHVCYPGSQYGTYDFCAPDCAPAGTEQSCAAAGAPLSFCDPTAPVCGEGLQCLRTCVTANEGICAPVDVCGRDDECRDPLRRQCLAKVVGDAYGAGLPPGMLNNLWCLQGECNDLSPCEAGYTCLGGVPFVQKIAPVCAPNCVRDPRDSGVDEFCPRSFVCATKVLPSLPYRFCLPGLYGFPCEDDDQCLVGKCRSLGSHARACTIECSTTADCTALYSPSEQPKADARCVDGQCVTAFTSYMQYLCDPTDSRCPAGASCVRATDLATDGGIPGVPDIGEYICWKPCPNGVADCAGNGTARACLNFLEITICVPGLPTPFIECDPTDPDACLKGLECKASPLAWGARHYCTISCQGDAPCQNHPWLPTDWHCRGTAGNQVCAP